ncbi:DUF3718 domain-containing protein [Echinimonas agarilytica]|uniref:DUF3718 domain-containing protein n=1 Tax=Echinimonas agarilytica TaxID=1215918 RepID=A0AA41W649_9GAMM|nr:DUF3718 domain-containing protein [Echinimonas agarilytica]MCM2679397.1 DUF3718 domain-containing protein [Echinimonas agarilytica]
MKLSIITAILTVGVLNVANANAAMDPFIENTLVKICEQSTNDQMVSFKKLVKSYRLDMKDVANKIVCNGEDIGTFAAENGASSIANLIREHQAGTVKVSEIAGTPAALPPQA